MLALTARRVLLAGVLTILATPSAASSASAPVDFSLTFASSAPGTPADMRLRLFYRHPDDPEKPPPALTRVEIAAPAGTRIDGSAVPACRASDAEFALRGRAACPPASRVGGGHATVMTSLGGDPYALDVTLFNEGTGIIELFTLPGTGVALLADRARFTAPGTMVLEPPVFPGVHEREFDLSYSRAIVTTPPTCASGEWASRVTYSDTTGATYTATTTAPCSKPAAVKKAKKKHKKKRKRRGKP